MTKLEGRVALVTGGARGLGAAAARALAGEGAKVVVSDIGDGTETASAVGGAYIKHDVTSEADWARRSISRRRRSAGSTSS
jgi:NAD(P)-dependent dehydrogenase (short-subunit alcohol dehydrogenase family)